MKPLTLSDSEKATVAVHMAALTRILPDFHVALHLQRIYGVHVPRCHQLRVDTDWVARGTALHYILQVVEFESAASFLRPLGAVAAKGNEIDMCLAAAEQGLANDAAFVREFARTGEDATTLKVVFDRQTSTWGTAVCGSVVTRFTHRNVLKDVAAYVEDADSLISDIKEARAADADPDVVAARMDGLAFLQGCLQGLICGLKQQFASAVLFGAAPADGSGSGSATFTASDTALDVGDVSFLALLDLTDSRLTSRERVAVANIYARAECRTSSDTFRRALSVHLGDRVFAEVQRVGLA